MCFIYASFCFSKVSVDVMKITYVSLLHSITCVFLVSLLCELWCCVGMPVSQMSHRQSLPNLSRSSKLSLATVPRSVEQQRGAPARRASAQAVTGNNYRLQSQLKQQNQGVSKVTPSRQQASLKSAAAREQSPSSSLLAARTDGTSRQTSRLTAASRLDLALSTS